MPTKKKLETTKIAKHGLGYWFRSVLIWVILVVSCASLVGYISVRWVERQVLTPDNWVSFVEPLPKNPTISTAVGNYVSSQLFNNVPVQQYIENALPPRASFLASPLTSQVKTIVNNTSQKVVSSDAFQSVWTTANRLAITRLVNNARGQTPQAKSKLQSFAASLNLNGIKTLINNNVGSVSQVLPTLSSSKTNISFGADLKTKTATIDHYIRTADFLDAILPMLTIASLIGAVALSRNRRRLVLIVSVVNVCLSLLILIGVKALRPNILNQIQDQSYKPAVGVVYDSLVKSFNHITYVNLIIWVVIALICMVLSPSKAAVKLRSVVHIKRTYKSSVYLLWRKVQIWLAKYRFYIWGVLAILALIYLAFLVTVDWKQVINSFLVLVLLISFSQIIATPTVRKVD